MECHPLAEPINELARMHIEISSMNASCILYLVLKNEFNLKRHELFVLAKEINMSRKELKTLIKSTVKKQQALRTVEIAGGKARSHELKTLTVGYPMKFGRILPGEFTIQNTNSKITLTQPIEVGQTPVTQTQWVEIMGQNPSKHIEGKDQIGIRRNNELIPVLPNHPVENLSFWSTLVFLNKLSEQRKLTPAYDLSGIEFTGTAKHGTLQAVDGVGEGLKIQARDNDIYRAEGYRLPTAAEGLYLLTNLGQIKSARPFDIRSEALDAYSWFDRNSQGMTHAVRSNQESILINGDKYSDFIGNVIVWAQDNFAFGRPQFEQGTNPVARIPNAVRSVIWGASFEYNADRIRLGERRSYPMNFCSKTLGLRVVCSLGSGDH